MKIELLLNTEIKQFLEESMTSLRDIWEETSYRIDMLQANPECVKEEKTVIYARTSPEYTLSFTPEKTPANFA